MGLVRAVVFDLDDTLYLEREYVASGFRVVAASISLRSSLRESEVFAWLWERFLSGDRGDNFDRLLQYFPQLSQLFVVSDLVTLYRNHDPCLQLHEGIANLLDAVDTSGSETAIITDGPVVSQTAKIRALGLEHRIGKLVHTDEWGAQFRKPHPRAYQYVAAETGIPATECLYIGDNPEKDFSGARKLGWKTIRLRIPGQLHYATNASVENGADIEVGSVGRLTELVIREVLRND